MAKEHPRVLAPIVAPGAAFWAAVSATPAKTVIDLSQVKTVISHFLLELSGQYDQSVGAETQATEGNPVLIQEVHLLLDGVPRRAMSGPLLFEINRRIAGGAMPKTDPATGVANNKAFSSKFVYPMIFMDMERETIVGRDGRPRMKSVAASTLLDLNNYQTAALEIIWAPFSSYVSGNTQANMNVNALKATAYELPGKRISKEDQRHFELLLAASQDMTQTINDKELDLFRGNKSIYGLVCRVGTLAATPIVTATTALTNMGVRGTKVNGDADELKPKVPVSTYQGIVAWPNIGIQFTAGYIFVDFTSDRRETNLLKGADYSALKAWFDIVGTANTTMQIFQAVRNK